jgi:uncharacterized protein with HEPN domain
MLPEDAIRVRHMIEAAEAAGTFIAGRRRADLDSDRMLLFALVRAIETIGEAASRLSAERRATMPLVPWASVVAIGHRLVHAYFDVDREIVWKDGDGRESAAPHLAAHRLEGVRGRPRDPDGSLPLIRKDRRAD